MSNQPRLTFKRLAEGKRKDGFTLVELLVVVAIIALLLGILLPALGRAREIARQTACLQQLRQIALGVRMYADDNSDYLPFIPSFNTQGLQFVRLDSYLSNRRIFQCPSAEVTGTSGEVWDDSRFGGYYGGPYRMWLDDNNDDRQQENEIYHTDYKLADNKQVSTPNGPRPGIMLMRTSSLPLPTWTVVGLDIDWGTPEDSTIARHGDGTGENLTFLDGHSEFMTRDKFWGNSDDAFDPLGNRPWFVWGHPDGPIDLAGGSDPPDMPN